LKQYGVVHERLRLLALLKEPRDPRIALPAAKCSDRALKHDDRADVDLEPTVA
jgi:hypothetical protein